jgi:hypothetical protein
MEQCYMPCGWRNNNSPETGRSRAKAPAVPAMPQPPSYNFIRYRMTRQQPDAPSTNPGVPSVSSAWSGVRLRVADHPGAMSRRGSNRYANGSLRIALFFAKVDCVRARR